MAKNRQAKKSVESSESEEIGSAGSDSESDPTQVAKKPSSATQPQKQIPADSSSSSGDEESGSDSDSDSDGPNPNQPTPVAIKPKEGQHKSTYLARKPVASEFTSPVKSAAAKRPAEEKETEATPSKKAKKNADEPESSARKSSAKKLFQRLWSEEDEIALLKGMIAAKNNANGGGTIDFHDFIKKDLHVDVSKGQVHDKLRKLKSKFVNNKANARTFSNPHDQKLYDLSETIWGDQVVEKVAKSNRKKTLARGANAPVTDHGEKTVAVAAVNGDGQSSWPAPRFCYGGGGSLEDSIVMNGEQMFATGKWVDKASEWNKLKMEEACIIQRHMELKAAQLKIVLDAMKSDDH